MSRFLPLWTVLLLTLAVFFSTITFDFVNWDDESHVYRNPVVTGERTGSVRDWLLTPELGYPSPLTILSYRLEVSVFGLRPAAFHATNLLLHLASVALLFLLAASLGFGSFPSAFAALIFALHPAVAETVSWVTGRKDLLATMFVLASACCWIRDRPKLAWALFTAAALSKPSALFLPLFLLTTGRGWKRTLPFWFVAVPVACLAFLGQQSIGAVRAGFPVLVWAREVWYSLGYHLGLLFWLHPFSPKHIPLHRPPGFDPLVDLVPPVVALLLLILARRLPGKWRALFLLGAAWGGFAYLPNSNLVPLARFLADTYLYTPLAGAALAFAAVFGAIEESLPIPRGGRLLTVFFLSVAVFLGGRAHLESLKWRNGVTLWSYTAGLYPDSPQVCRDLGNAHMAGGNPARALQQYRTCAAFFGGSYFMKNEAIALFVLNRRRESGELFRKLKIQSPNDPVVLKYLSLLNGGAE
jgi:hypothetical protein